MTTKYMEWLNQNRGRSYPMDGSEWRRKASPESGLDCVLLDALIFDADANGDEDLRVKSVTVEAAGTTVVMAYGGREFSVRLEGGDESGEGSYECIKGVVGGSGARGASMTLCFSSHAHIRSAMGDGTWEIGARVLPSRVIRIGGGFGVDAIHTRGSSKVRGSADASGEVVLEDGYGTSPVISGGKVLVRVGKRYGLKACKYDFGSDGDVDCRRPLFYFCGQNGINSGNVTIKGGKGITVKQGGTYRLRDGYQADIADRSDIPCIEIVAGKELLDIYRP